MVGVALPVVADQPQSSAAQLAGDSGASVKAFGARGDGVTDDTIALQAAFDSMPEGGTVVLPDGVYIVSGSPHIDGNDVTVEFSGNAWIRPTAGVGLRVNGQRVVLKNPKIRIDGGDPSAGIWVGTSSGSFSVRCTIIDPVVWAFSNIVGQTDGIVVDNMSFWCQIVRPRFRRDSGTLTGTFRRLISFTNTSNAGVVEGGDFAHAAVGVYIADSNSILVHGSAFEGVLAGVELAGLRGAGGTRVINTRHESGTDCINITTAYLTNNAPLYFAGISRISNVVNLVRNPNGVAYTMLAGSQFSLVGNGYGDSYGASIDLTTFSSQLKDALTVKSSLGARTFAIGKNGDVVVSSNSAAWPTRTDTVGIFRHYAGVTYIGSIHPTSTSGEVVIATGNAAGGAARVMSVIGTAVRPGAKGTIDLGQASAAWRNGYFAGYVRVGVVSAATRPSASVAGAGAQMFDIGLGKPIWSNGSKWVDARGVTI